MFQVSILTDGLVEVVFTSDDEMAAYDVFIGEAARLERGDHSVEQVVQFTDVSDPDDPRWLLEHVVEQD